MSCAHYGYQLKEDDRHFIYSEEHNNCVLCLVNEKGSMTQEEVAHYMHLTKMRICQIEHSATKKMKKKVIRYMS